jgi:hypothetical protein
MTSRDAGESWQPIGCETTSAPSGHLGIVGNTAIGANANQGRGPRPKQIDGAGIVYAVVLGWVVWIVIAGIAHAVARWWA